MPILSFFSQAGLFCCNDSPMRMPQKNQPLLIALDSAFKYLLCCVLNFSIVSSGQSINWPITSATGNQQRRSLTALLLSLMGSPRTSYDIIASPGISLRLISQALFQQRYVARQQGQSPSSSVPYSASAPCGVPHGGLVEAGTTSS